MADGVPIDKLYPLDVDRAFRKLEEIRPAGEGLVDSGCAEHAARHQRRGEFLSMWNARAPAANKQGGHVGFTYNQATSISSAC